MIIKRKIPPAVITLARCAKSKDFYGIRFEEIQSGIWNGTWAFKITQYTAKKEGFDKGKIAGTIKWDDHFPGCPYCGSGGVFTCGKCHETSCWDGRSEIVCPWCYSRERIIVTNKLQFKTGRDL